MPNSHHFMQNTIRILKYATIKAECYFFMIFFCFVDRKLIYLKDSHFQISIKTYRFERGALVFCKLQKLRKFT